MTSGLIRGGKLGWLRLSLSVFVAFLGGASLRAEEPQVVELSVEPNQVGSRVDWGMLMSGNNALWFEKERLTDEETESFLKDWSPSLLRIPGGSWSDEFFWNGNGVRTGKELDASSFVDGKWQIDYSAYKPGFRVKDVKGGLSDYHGVLDMKYLHDFSKERGIATMATVNAGSATAHDAAEWVKWANVTNDYGVKHWEVGNELEGDWEVGHIRADGKKMDADTYAKLFIRYAKAMKAVDPRIKMGGPVCSNATLPFVETLIKKAGDHLDFVAFHTYPVEGQRGPKFRYRKASVKEPVAKIRGWLKKYQPERAEEIEIAVTEWHVQVAETKPTVDITSALWSTLFIKSLAEEGVDIACQWDLYSTTPTGGHGFFDHHKSGLGRRAQAHLFAMLRKGLGSEMLTCTGETEDVRCLVTREDGEPRVLLINLHPTESKSVRIKGIDLPKTAQRFSNYEYFWNDIRQAPEWTKSAANVSIEVKDRIVKVPPQTIYLLNNQAKVDRVVGANHEKVIELILPEKSETDFPTKGYVVVKDGAGNPYEGEVEVTLQSSSGQLTAKKIIVNQAVAPFTLSKAEVGQVTITAAVDGKTTKKVIEIFKPKEKIVTVWDFEGKGEKLIGDFKSDYALEIDGKAIPNSSLAAVVLKDARAISGKNTLIQPKKLDLPMNTQRIRGMTLVIGKSADFKAPKGAGVMVVMQSELDHWIPLKTIPFSELSKPGHKDFEVIEVKIPFENKEQMEAMTRLYNVLLSLTTNEPVSGRLYVQSMGFILGPEVE